MYFLIFKKLLHNLNVMKGILTILMFLVSNTIVVAKEILNVGTVLFSSKDLKKSCWSENDVDLLKARRYYQLILPPPTLVDPSINNFENLLLTYFAASVNSIKKEKLDPLTRDILTIAMFDVIGGYMKAYVLPVIKYGYYGGTVAKKDAQKIYELYHEIKKYLKTDGSGWTDFDGDFKRSLKLIVKPPENNMRSAKGSCNQLAFYDETATGLNIPLPSMIFNNKTPIMFVPLKDNFLINLHSDNYSDILQKYYYAAKNCLKSRSPNDEAKFDSKFSTWLTNDVLTKLDQDEDHLCYALGGILGLAVNQFTKSEKLNEVKVTSPETNCKHFTSFDVDTNKLMILIIILFFELVGFILVLLCILCTKTKKKDKRSSLSFHVTPKKSKNNRLCNNFGSQTRDNISTLETNTGSKCTCENKFCKNNELGSKKLESQQTKTKFTNFVSQIVPKIVPNYSKATSHSTTSCSKLCSTESLVIEYERTKKRTKTSIISTPSMKSGKCQSLFIEPDLCLSSRGKNITIRLSDSNSCKCDLNTQNENSKSNQFNVNIQNNDRSISCECNSHTQKKDSLISCKCNSYTQKKHNSNSYKSDHIFNRYTKKDSSISCKCNLNNQKKDDSNLCEYSPNIQKNFSSNSCQHNTNSHKKDSSNVSGINIKISKKNNSSSYDYNTQKRDNSNSCEFNSCTQIKDNSNLCDYNRHAAKKDNCNSCQSYLNTPMKDKSNSCEFNLNTQKKDNSNSCCFNLNTQKKDNSNSCCYNLNVQKQDNFNSCKSNVNIQKRDNSNSVNLNGQKKGNSKSCNINLIIQKQDNSNSCESNRNIQKRDNSNSCENNLIIQTQDNSNFCDLNLNTQKKDNTNSCNINLNIQKQDTSNSCEDNLIIQTQDYTNSYDHNLNTQREDNSNSCNISLNIQKQDTSNSCNSKLNRQKRDYSNLCKIPDQDNSKSCELDLNTQQINNLTSSEVIIETKNLETITLSSENQSDIYEKTKAEKTSKTQLNNFIKPKVDLKKTISSKQNVMCSQKSHDDLSSHNDRVITDFAQNQNLIDNLKIQNELMPSENIIDNILNKRYEFRATTYEEEEEIVLAPLSNVEETKIKESFGFKLSGRALSKVQGPSKNKQSDVNVDEANVSRKIRSKIPKRNKRDNKGPIQGNSYEQSLKARIKSKIPLPITKTLDDMDIRERKKKTKSQACTHRLNVTL